MRCPHRKFRALDLRTLLERHLAQIAAQDARGGCRCCARRWRAPGTSSPARREAGRPACIVHGDLSHANVIGTGPPRLIDWEYAAVGDPLADLACLAGLLPAGAAARRGTAAALRTARGRSLCPHSKTWPGSTAFCRICGTGAWSLPAATRHRHTSRFDLSDFPERIHAFAASD